MVVKREGSITLASLLIAGQIVGISTFGMPLVTSFGGFYPAITAIFLIWLCTFAVALLYMELLWDLAPGTNLFSLVEVYLGRGVKYLIGFIFLAIHYPLLRAYYIEASPFLVTQLQPLGFTLPQEVATAILILLTGMILYFGLRATSKVNFILMWGLIGSLLFLLFKGAPGVTHHHFHHKSWFFIALSIPLLFNAYGLQYLVPPLLTYFGRNAKPLKISFFIGTFLSCILFALFVWLVIGSYSQRILWFYYQKEGATNGTIHLLNQTPWIQTPLSFLKFFAVITSLLAVGLAMVEMFGDALKIKEEKRVGKKRLFLVALVLLPPLIFLVFQNKWVIDFFDNASGFGEMIITMTMLWMGWLVKSRKTSTKIFLPGGRVVIGVLMILIFYFFWLQGLFLIY